MVTRTELESMRQELRKKAGERKAMKDAHETALDKLRSLCREKLMRVKIDSLDAIKPYAKEKEKAVAAAKTSLTRAVGDLEQEKRQDFRKVELHYRDELKKLEKECEGRIDKITKEFQEQSSRLAREYEAGVAQRQEENEKALEELKAQQDLELDKLEAEMKDIQASMASVGAA